MNHIADIVAELVLIIVQGGFLGVKPIIKAHDRQFLVVDLQNLPADQFGQNSTVSAEFMVDVAYQRIPVSVELVVMGISA